MSQTTSLLGSRFHIRNKSQAKALTGCFVAELEELLPVFERFLSFPCTTTRSNPYAGVALVAARQAYYRFRPASSSGNTHLDVRERTEVN